MNDVEVDVIEFDGKDYFLIDSILDQGNTYRFFANEQDNQDLLVMKDVEQDGEIIYKTIDSDYEFNYALSLFYKKYGESK